MTGKERYLAAVRHEVPDRLPMDSLGRHGGYIVSPDHSIKSDVPLENVLALYVAAREFRGEGYTQ